MKSDYSNRMSWGLHLSWLKVIACSILICACTASLQGIENQEALESATKQKQIVSDQEFIRKVAARLAHHEEVNPKDLDRFIRNFVTIKHDVPRTTTAQNGIDWKVNIQDDALREYGRLISEFTGCSQPVWVPTQMPMPPQYVSCKGLPHVVFFLDETEVKPIYSTRTNDFVDPYDAVMLQVRYPTTGIHRLTTRYTAYSSFKKEVSVVLEETSEIEVVKSEETGTTPVHDSLLREKVRSGLYRELADVLGPPAGNAWISLLLMDDPAPREINLAYRVKISVDEDAASLATGEFYSDQFSDDAVIELDLSRLSDGVHALAVSLEPDANLASKKQSSRPYLDEKITLGPLWLMRNPDSAKLHWIPDLVKLLANCRDFRLRWAAYQILKDFKEGSLPALSELRSLLKEDDQELGEPQAIGDYDAQRMLMFQRAYNRTKNLGGKTGSDKRKMPWCEGRIPVFYYGSNSTFDERTEILKVIQSIGIKAREAIPEVEALLQKRLDERRVGDSERVDEIAAALSLLECFQEKKVSLC